MLLGVAVELLKHAAVEVGLVERLVEEPAVARRVGFRLDDLLLAEDFVAVRRDGGHPRHVVDHRSVDGQVGRRISHHYGVPKMGTSRHG